MYWVKSTTLFCISTAIKFARRKISIHESACSQDNNILVIWKETEILFLLPEQPERVHRQSFPMIFSACDPSPIPSGLPSNIQNTYFDFLIIYNHFIKFSFLKVKLMTATLKIYSFQKKVRFLYIYYLICAAFVNQFKSLMYEK